MKHFLQQQKKKGERKKKRVSLVEQKKEPKINFFVQLIVHWKWRFWSIDGIHPISDTRMISKGDCVLFGFRLGFVSILFIF